LVVTCAAADGAVSTPVVQDGGCQEQEQPLVVVVLDSNAVVDVRVVVVDYGVVVHLHS
jgi:hypothetical protein